MRTKTRKPLVRGTTQRLPGGSKHATASKLSAIKAVKQLMLEGIAKWSALTQIGKDYNVSSATVSNWYNKYRDVTVQLRQTNGNIAHTLRNSHTDGFAIQSVNLRTTDGVHVSLTPTDINKIASLASTIC